MAGLRRYSSIFLRGWGMILKFPARLFSIFEVRQVSLQSQKQNENIVYFKIFVVAFAGMLVILICRLSENSAISFICYYT